MKIALCAPFMLTTFFCGTLLMSAHAESDAALPKATLLVVSQGDSTMSLVDTAGGKRIGTVVEGVPTMVGHEVATSRDGKLAYVPLYGDAGVGKPGTDGRVMLVIDLATQKIVDKVDFGHGVRPHCAILDPVSGMLYVTTELDKTVTIVDPKTLKVVGSIPTQQEQSHMLAISHDGRHGYTANVGPGTVSVLDLKARKFVTTIPIAQNTQRIAISNDDRYVFTADQVKPQMAVIDTSTNAIKTWVQLPSRGYGSAFTKDGQWLLVTLPAAGSLAVVDLKTMQVARTVKIGPTPQEVVVSPDGKQAYVSCYGASQVVGVDLANWQTTGSIDVGQKADGMAWAVSTR